MTKGQRFRVECRDCTFSKIVDRSRSDTLPADVLRKHGRETGHTLDVARLEDA